MSDLNEIWAQAYELGALIAESPEVAEYKRTQELMESHPEIKSLLNQLRDVQGEYDRLQSYGGGSHLKGLEDTIQTLIQQLDTYPEVAAFKQASGKVDELLQSVTILLSKCITSEINGEPLQESGSCSG